MLAIGIVQRKPALVVAMASFASGALFALGHHEFYKSLNGRIVRSQDEQEWNIRIGTGLAFSVKLCLGTAAGIAYTQALWYTLKDNPVKVRTIDALFDLPRNLLYLANIEVWKKGYILAPVAALIWALPLMAVFTPGALTVQSSSQVKLEMKSIPQPAFNLTHKNLFAHQAQAGGGIFAGPSNTFARLVSTVLAQGRIQPFTALYPNCEYDLVFYGPVLSCATLQLDANHTEDYNKPLSLNNGGYTVTFSAFVPDSSNQAVNMTLQERIVSAFHQSLDSSAIPPTSDESSSDHARLLFYVPYTGDYEEGTHSTTECGLYNASYHATVRFDNNQQSVLVHNVSNVNGIPFTVNQQDGIDLDVPDFIANTFVDAIGRHLAGRVTYSHYGTSIPLYTDVFSTVLTQTRDFDGDEPLESHDRRIIGNITVAEAIEQLSRNISLSLFADSHFLSNDKDLPTIPLKTWTSQLEYTYNPRNVYAAYFAGVGVTLAAVCTGVFCIVQSSVTYSTSFSTILRTTRGSDLDRLITPALSSGAEPLCERLAEKTLAFGQVPATGFSLTDATTFRLIEKEE